MPDEVMPVPIPDELEPDVGKLELDPEPDTDANTEPYLECDNCHDIIPAGADTYEMSDPPNQTWCEDCYNDKGSSCDGCGNYVEVSSLTEVNYRTYGRIQTFVGINLEKVVSKIHAKVAILAAFFLYEANLGLFFFVEFHCPIRARISLNSLSWLITSPFDVANC